MSDPRKNLTFYVLILLLAFGAAALLSAYVSAGRSSGSASLGRATGLANGTAFPVLGGVVLTQISTGWHHTCGLTPAGSAYCWGNNSYAQIGYGGSLSPQVQPLAVGGGLVFQSVYAAGFGWFNCGVATFGTGYCWGSNGHGQLGIGTGGTGQRRTTPMVVQGGLTFRVIRPGGDFACGLTISGGAYCWGANAFGQLGDGTTTERFSPVPVEGGLVFQEIAAGGVHACGLTALGKAYCWGGNMRGQLGDGTTTMRLTPVAVAGGLVLRTLTTGGRSTCGLTYAAATAYCWGANASGQLGDGSFSVRRTPVPVVGDLTFASFEGRGNTVCGVHGAGLTYCWGENSSGEGGNGTRTDSSIPVAVTVGPAFNAVTVGGAGSCGLTAGGAAWCWGSSYSRAAPPEDASIR